jgi:hypothetical protein
MARQFGKVLFDTGARPAIDEAGEFGEEGAPLFIKRDASKLLADGPKKFEALVEAAIGGVIFIDEAHRLEPKTKSVGKEIFSILMMAAEDHRDKITFILAGYKEDIMDNLYSYDDGFNRRFTAVDFKDFSRNELLTIWNGILEQQEARIKYKKYHDMLKEKDSADGDRLSPEERLEKVEAKMKNDGVNPDVLNHSWRVEDERVSKAAANRVSATTIVLCCSIDRSFLT